MCAEPATHKVGEEIPSDDPELMRHNYTAYVCCKHFRLIFGSAVPCDFAKWGIIETDEEFAERAGAQAKEVTE